jgi:hypothetical protein
MELKKQLKDWIEKDFLKRVEKKEVEVYNEFSLQHELGIFLREKLKENNLTEYKVQFERNAEEFFNIPETIKHEIDIVIFKGDPEKEIKEKYAIELKYPLNGQYPEQMFSFVKDIKFMKELKDEGFDGTYCLTLVKDKLFYSGRTEDGIYSYFRGENPVVYGEIEKPTGKEEKKYKIPIKEKYEIKWMPCDDKKYYLVEI